jgi:hypothetical protein
VTTLSTDTFNRTNSTSVVGSTDGAGTKDPLTWTTRGGTCGINTNQAYASALASLSGVGNVGLATVDLATADVDISLTFATIGTGAAIVFHYNSNNDYWIWAELGSNALLYKLVSGTLTGPLGTYAGAADGDVMRVVTNGSTIKIYRGASLLDTKTDSHLSTITHHGFLVFGTNARPHPVGVGPVGHHNRQHAQPGDRDRHRQRPGRSAVLLRDRPQPDRHLLAGHPSAGRCRLHGAA